MKSVRTILLPLLLASAIGAAATPAVAQNLHKRRAHVISLIQDHRATYVGDILTVLIGETHKVKNEDKVNRSSETTLAASLEAFTLKDNTFGNELPSFDVRKEQTQTGQAKQERDSTVTARVAVIVVDVQPNGNLVVAGTRAVKVDDEQKTLRISGIVRPLDVKRDNTVSSSQVADARVDITGTGANTRTVTRGPVATVFDTLIWAAWPF